MSAFIVTVKIAKDPGHNPHNKVTALCPLNKTKICTDVTGEHHSEVVTAFDTAEEVTTHYRALGYHVTRVEGI